MVDNCGDNLPLKKYLTLGSALLAVTLFSCSGAKQVGETNDLLEAADLKKGQAIAVSCSACHSLERGGKNEAGPNLFGIVGARVRHDSDFVYSPALQLKQDFYWTIDHLDRWLNDPQSVIPGNKMLFTGLHDPQDRMDLIAYLMTLR